MSSPLSRASSRWSIISLCRRSSRGIVALLPVLVVGGLYGSPEAFQGDFASAIESTTSSIGSLHPRRLWSCSSGSRPRTASGPAVRTEDLLWLGGEPGGRRRRPRRTPSPPHGTTP